MAQKKFLQNFAVNFKGIDGLSSALEEDAGNVNRAVNYELAIGNSLRGSVGCQTQGGNGFFGIFPYTYTRTQDQYDIKYQVAAGTYPNQTPDLSSTKTTADGASIEKLIAINQQMWVLDTMTVPLTYVSGSYPFTWYTTVSGSNINFVMKANGSTILDTSLQTGLALASRTTIYSLLGTIDALANFSVTRGTRGVCPPFAIVNGNQTAVAAAPSILYGLPWTITVTNTPHTFKSGDLICFPSCTIPVGSSPTVNTMASGFVVSVTATTVTYVGPQVTLVNGDILGYMGQPAATFPITTVATAASGNPSLVFKYWRNIPECAANLGDLFIDGMNGALNKSTNNWYQPPSYTNSQGDLFIATSRGAGFASSTAATTPWTNKLIKTDSQAAYKAGLPAPAPSASVSGAGARTGTYRYKGFYRRRDAQGNIIDGPTGPVSTIVLAAQATTVATLSGSLIGEEGILSRACIKHTTESPGSGAFFYVDDEAAAVGDAPFIMIGDPILYVPTATHIAGLTYGLGPYNMGQLKQSVCTGYCAQAATISPTTASIQIAATTAGTISADVPISTGLTLVFLRTTAGGNVFYELCEIPVIGTGAVTFTDNATDAAMIALAPQYIEAEIGKEHDAPPDCSIVCQHQGGLVVARSFSNPNTVSFSTAEGIEYFPLASNSFDVPSTQSGAITAIASDTNDRLAVFKDKAYYDIVGDLDGGNFSVNVKGEGDYGVTSQASLIRVKNVLIGLSRHGFIQISDGQLDPFFFKELNARISNQNYNFQWAVACNDADLRRYICSIPTQTNGSPQTLVIDYSRDQIHTFEQSFASQMDPAAGMVSLKSNFYHLSEMAPYCSFVRLPRFNGDSPTGNNGDSFLHNTSAISYILESNVINNGEPDVLNTPIRIRLWSIPNDYVVDGWVPFAVLVEGGASPIAAYIGSSSPGGTSSTLTFSTTNDIFKDVKLIQTVKTHFYIVKFTTNTARQAPFITGYEIVYAENYKPEDLVK